MYHNHWQNWYQMTSLHISWYSLSGETNKDNQLFLWAVHMQVFVHDQNKEDQFNDSFHSGMVNVLGWTDGRMIVEYNSSHFLKNCDRPHPFMLSLLSAHWQLSQLLLVLWKGVTRLPTVSTALMRKVVKSSTFRWTSIKSSFQYQSIIP